MARLFVLVLLSGLAVLSASTSFEEDEDLEQVPDVAEEMDLEAWVPWGSFKLPERASSYTASTRQTSLPVGGMFWPGIDPSTVSLGPGLTSWLESNKYQEYWTFPTIDFSRDVDHNVNTKNSECGLECDSEKSTNCIECPADSTPVVIGGKIKCLSCPTGSVLNSENQCLKSYSSSLTYEVRCPTSKRVEMRGDLIACVGGRGGPTQNYGLEFFDESRNDLCRFHRLTEDAPMIDGLEVLRLKRYGGSAEEFYDDFDEDESFELTCLAGDALDHKVLRSGSHSQYEALVCKRTVHLPVALDPTDKTDQALCPRGFVKSPLNSDKSFTCSYPYASCPKLYLVRFQCGPNTLDYVRQSGQVMTGLFDQFFPSTFTEYEELCVRLKEIAHKMQCISYLNMLREHYYFDGKTYTPASVSDMHALTQNNQFLKANKFFKFLPGSATISVDRGVYQLTAKASVTNEKQSPGRVCALGGMYNLATFKACLSMVDSQNYPFLIPSKNWGAQCTASTTWANEPLSDSICEDAKTKVSGGRDGICGVGASK